MSSIPVFDISNPLGGLLDQAVAMSYVNEKRTTTKGAVASFENNIEHPVSIKADIDPSLDGVSAVNVVRTGANVFDKSDLTWGKWYNADGSRVNHARYGVMSKMLRCERPKTIFVNCAVKPNSFAIVFFDKNGDFLLRVLNNKSTRQAEIPPSDAYWVIIQLSCVISEDITQAYIDNIGMIVSIGTEVSTYEPYSATTRTISLGSTVYGGSVSISEEGEVELTTTYAAYSFTGTEEWTLDTDETYFETELTLGTALFTDDSAYMTSNGIILRLQDDGKTIRAYLADNESLTAESDMNEVFTNTDKLVYELETSSKTDLTDIDPIETLEGENNIWADTGDIEVGYYYQLYQPI